MAAASVRMVMTASLLLARSTGVAATAAPAAATGFTFSAERFQTVTVCPTSISRCAMAAPILPIPPIPICILPPTAFSALPLHCASRCDDTGLHAREIVLAAAGTHIALERSRSRRVASDAACWGEGRLAMAKRKVGVVGLGIMG